MASVGIFTISFSSTLLYYRADLSCEASCGSYRIQAQDHLVLSWKPYLFPSKDSSDEQQYTRVHRIFNRLGTVKTKASEKTEEALRRIIPKKFWFKVNERFVKFGKQICLPIKLQCPMCPVSKYCEYYAKVVAPKLAK